MTSKLDNTEEIGGGGGGGGGINAWLIFNYLPVDFIIFNFESSCVSDGTGGYQRALRRCVTGDVSTQLSCPL